MNNEKPAKNDDYDDINDFQMIDEDINLNRKGLLTSIFDEVNTTQMNDRDLTILTPKQHKIFVQDTPVECYGIY